MFIEMAKRQYKMRQRAEEQERTRQTIVEATAELHGSVGPKNTSISAIAKKAGVQRLTVYRHFPTEEALFHACTSHWLSENPPPAIEAWAGEETASGRTRRALGAIYDYYQQTNAMWRLSYRDLDQVPALRAPMEAFHDYLGEIRDDLLSFWQPKGRKSPALRATIWHALTFTTWASLAEQGIGKRQMVDLVGKWIASSAPESGAG
jgi:AcrR family transcriptional regulator